VMNHQDDQEVTEDAAGLDSGVGRTVGQRMVSIRMDKIGAVSFARTGAVEYARTGAKQQMGFGNIVIGQTGTRPQRRRQKKKSSGLHQGFRSNVDQSGRHAGSRRRLRGSHSEAFDPLLNTNCYGLKLSL